ncbi:hypothetical protein EXIGLDRAFT_692127 [Exidia glandulosa HHB12029]|uniref:Alpha-type protein kinase domain-containing protein n=1 Tax=Exidia glandulosa HHB12029 TaxID=1314781 RepID=A0A166AL06_EXIGL|nr:hypothetical protein EXIGLDRAFT_692127 [Exidia glandulosa HHB12029]
MSDFEVAPCPEPIATDSRMGASIIAQRTHVNQGITHGWKRGSSTTIQAVGQGGFAVPSRPASASQAGPGYRPSQDGDLYLQTRSDMARQSKRPGPLEPPAAIAAAITVKLFMMFLPEGQITRRAVGDVMVSIPNVGLHTGGRALNLLCRQRIFDKWDKYSYGFPFPDDVTLITKDEGVELACPSTHQPNLSVLAPHVKYSGKSNAKIPKPLELALMISFRDFNRLQEHVKDVEAGADACAQAQRGEGNSLSADNRATGAKRTRTPSTSETAVFTAAASRRGGTQTPPPQTGKRDHNSIRARDDEQVTPPPKRPPQPLVSPQSSRIRNFLANIPQKRWLTRIVVNKKWVAGKLYVIEKYTSFEECLSKTPISPTNMGIPLEVEVYRDLKAIASPGVFKAAYPGELRGRTVDAEKSLHAARLNGAVCVKKAIIKGRGNNGVKPAKDDTALPILIKEGVNIAVAAGLQTLVEDFVARESARLEKEDILPEIPELAFVEVGIFIADAPVVDDDGVFLIETRLDTTSWDKYIGNASTRPFTALKGGERDGKYLTDPQIITSPEFTDKFSDGNIEAGWQSLVKDHECNAYCEIFGLKDPFMESDGFKPRQVISVED